MATFKSIAGAALRSGLWLTGKAGVALQPRRDSRNRITGLNAQWGRSEDNMIRGLVIEREIDGHPVRFFVSDESDAIQQEHMAGRWYEEQELALIRTHYRGGTFVDVGSNVGNHSLFAAIRLNAPVIAFEPNPPAYQNCVYNFLLNGLGDRAVVHRIGLSDQEGTAKVGPIAYRNLGATKLVTGVGPLILKRGDDVLADDPVGFIKIDVEGMELSTLRGLEETIRKHGPVIMVEVDNANIDAFKHWLDQQAYEVVEKLPKWDNANFIIRPRQDARTALA